MAFFKLVKNNAYFKRYQVKYRRRREGKTDYHARKALIIQDKNKYNTAKYRLVARITNSKIICQIVTSKIVGDKVICSAESSELKRFGLTAGLANYASAYATGLLIARRLLKQLEMDTIYKGIKEADGVWFDITEQDYERRPFKAVLDTGLVRTTTGNRVFGALKGAADGGIHVPHSENRFPGFVKDEDGNKEYKPETHRDRIFGKHVENYYNELKGESQEDFVKQFSQWQKCLQSSGAKSISELYKKVHAAIRADPSRAAKKEVKKKYQPKKGKGPQKRLTGAQKKKNAQIKLNKAIAAIQKKQKNK